MITYNLFDMGANSGIGMTSNAGWNMDGVSQIVVDGTAQHLGVGDVGGLGSRLVW